jgi:HAMP domain-containing protein
MVIVLLGLLGFAVAWGLRARRSREAAFRAGGTLLVAAARGRLLERVGSVERAADAVAVGDSIWEIKDEGLVIRADVPFALDSSFVFDAAVDYAAVRARELKGQPPTEAQVTKWLSNGVNQAIGWFVMGSLQRREEVLKRLGGGSRPTPQARAVYQEELRREWAEIGKLHCSRRNVVAPPSAVARKRS